MVSQIFVSIKNLGKFQSLDKRKAEIRKCTGPQKDKVFQSRFLLFKHFCCFLKGEWYLLAAWLNETKASKLKTLLCHTSGPPAERHQVACARKLCNLLPSSTPSLYHLISLILNHHHDNDNQSHSPSKPSKSSSLPLSQMLQSFDYRWWPRLPISHPNWPMRPPNFLVPPCFLKSPSQQSGQSSHPKTWRWSRCRYFRWSNRPYHPWPITPVPPV